MDRFVPRDDRAGEPMTRFLPRDDEVIARAAAA
jgi:hypothetical protein